MDTDERVKRLAKWYYDRLKQDTRSNGKTFYKFVGEGDDTRRRAEEERCTALSLAAHDNGRIFPDDWRFEFINEALSAIMDADDFDEITLEADIYNSELTEWVGSHAYRPGYCDDASDEGLCGGDANLITRLQMGQYLEKREVLGQVLEHLREEAEAEEEEEAEADKE